MNNVDLSDTKVGDETARAVGVFLEHLIGQPDVDIQSVILYGSAAGEDFRPGKSDINLLVVARNIDVSSLRKFLDPVFQGRQANIAPFFLTFDDIVMTADIFPLKFMGMKNRYRVLYGDDILSGLIIDRENMVIRIRQRIGNMLLKMRRYYIVNGGQRLTAMMVRQIKRFVETLGFILIVKGVTAGNPREIIDISAKEFGLDAVLLKEIYSLLDEESALPGDRAEKYFGTFLDALKTVSGSMAKLRG